MARFIRIFMLFVVIAMVVSVSTQPQVVSCLEQTEGMEKVLESRSIDYGGSEQLPNRLVFDLESGTVSLEVGGQPLDVTPSEGNTTFFQEYRMSLSVTGEQSESSAYGVIILLCSGEFYFKEEPYLVEIEIETFILPIITPTSSPSI